MVQNQTHYIIKLSVWELDLMILLSPFQLKIFNDFVQGLKYWEFHMFISQYNKTYNSKKIRT